MNFTITTTSKGQVTIPKKIRDKFGLKSGAKIDIYATSEGFIAKPKNKSKILNFAGDMAHLDKGESISDIIEKSHYLGAVEIAKKVSSK